ncbi:hypothetical protein Gotri_020539, partial [Gossypium trilobum]|nr:hypothetical protein [Gossypium trilobum]
KGFIHSDLKPSNILAFTPQHGTCLPTLKIANFGLAKQQGAKDTRSRFRGTKYYMSPESIVGKVSGALDIWSLGCIVRQVVKGRITQHPGRHVEARKEFLVGMLYYRSKQKVEC